MFSPRYAKASRSTYPMSKHFTAKEMSNKYASHNPQMDQSKCSQSWVTLVEDGICEGAEDGTGKGATGEWPEDGIGEGAKDGTGVGNGIRVGEEDGTGVGNGN